MMNTFFVVSYLMQTIQFFGSKTMIGLSKYLAQLLLLSLTWHTLSVYMLTVILVLAQTNN